MDIRNYIFERDFKITILNNQINVVNYLSIESVSTNKITLKYEKGILDISGDNLVIKKLLNDEILIIGNIKSLELRWLNV